MNIFVRESTPNDMPQVLGLIKELAVFEKSPNAVEVTVETLIKEGFGLNPLFTCFVAEVDQEIVGMALIYYRFSTWKGRSLHLEDLIVKEAVVGEGPTMKRFVAKARGMAGRILKRSSHLKIVLTNES